MEQRGRFGGIAAIAAALALVVGVVAAVKFTHVRPLLGGHSRAAGSAADDGPGSSSHATIGGENASGGDAHASNVAASRTSDLPPLPPPREGMVRYHARIVRTDGKPHSGFISEAKPAGASETQTLPQTEKGDVTVDASAECAAIDFTSRGFKTVHHVVTQRELETGELGSIMFEQAATLKVVLLHAPRNDAPWLDVYAFAKVPAPQTWGDSMGFGNTKVATPRGDADALFFVPSETPITIGVNGDGVNVRRVLPSLGAGANTCTVDFTQTHSLRGRIVGIPPGFAKGFLLSLQCFTTDRDGLFPGMDVRVRLDEKARFAFTAIPDDPFTFRVELADSVHLRAAGGDHRVCWRPEELPPERELELEPREPLLGVAVGPLEGKSKDERYCQLSIIGAKPAWIALQPSDDPRFVHGIMRAAALQSGSKLRLDLGGDGDLVRQIGIPVEQLPPPKDQVLTIRLDQLHLGTASLTVGLGWFASRDWKVLLTPAGQSPYSSSEPTTVRRERGLFSFRFTDLDAGSYDVWSSLQNSWFHRVASGITLGEGESASLDVELPERSRVAGLVTNWTEIPESLRPREIALDSSATIVDGRFELSIFRPITEKASFTAPGDRSLGIQADVETRADGSIAVAYPVNELALFELAVSVPEGHLASASILRPNAPETLGIFDHPESLGGNGHGKITVIRRRDETLRGWVSDHVRGEQPRILAFFSSDIPTGTIVPSGRYVEIENAADGTIATLYLVARKLGDWRPPRIPVYKVIAGLPRRLWLPDGAEFLDVESEGRPVQRVETAAIGVRWTVPPP